MKQQQQLREQEKRDAEERVRQQKQLEQDRMKEIYLELEQKRNSGNLDEVSFLDFQASWLSQIFDPDYPIDYGNSPGQNRTPGVCHLIREDSFALPVNFNSTPENLYEILERIGIWGLSELNRHLI